MNKNIIRVLSIAALMFAATSGSRAALLYSGDAGVIVTGPSTVETGFESIYNSGSATPFVSANSLIKRTGTTFASSAIGGFESDNVQNGIYPTDNSSPGNPWLPTSNGTEFVGVTFSFATDIQYVGFGTQYSNRSSGGYTIQYTIDNLDWISVGLVQLVSENNVLGRNLFDVGALSNVLGVRISGFADTGLGSASVSVSELEIYSIPEPGTYAMALLGGACLLALRRRRSAARPVIIG